MCVAEKITQTPTPPVGPHRRWRRAWRAAPLVIAAGVTLFLQLKAVPSLSDVPHVPRAWVAFFDTHDFLKNALGFGGLAAAVQFASFGMRPPASGPVLWRTGGLMVTVAALELAQVFLPERSCDWHDIVAGCLGIAISCFFWIGMVQARNPRGS